MPYVLILFVLWCFRIFSYWQLQNVASLSLTQKGSEALLPKISIYNNLFLASWQWGTPELHPRQFISRIHNHMGILG